MGETETACRTRNGSYVDHDFWDDGSGYECRRCGATLDDDAPYDDSHDGAEERNHAYRQHLWEQLADCPLPPSEPPQEQPVATPWDGTAPW